ncbi:MAG: secondary thiamine-phosphate synthase enzyme YjbQ [Spirochaetota bacterium]
MVHEITLKSGKREEFINVDHLIRDTINSSGVKEGTLTLFVPHTTAALTINEHADPSVLHDIISTIGTLIPRKGNYQHAEGNSDAHIKASLLGNSQTLIIKDGRPLLGTWQSVFFCEFDGPRTRKLILHID